MPEPMLSPAGHPYTAVTHGTKAGTSEDYYVPGAGPNKTNQNVERKTANTVESKTANATPQVGAGAGVNVLNNYRSVTYNFTLAALRVSQLNDPGTFDSLNPEFVVATTRGKKKAGISTYTDVGGKQPTVSASSEQTTDSKQVSNASNQVVDQALNQAKKDAIEVSKSNRVQNAGYVSDQLKEFNKSSPGRFDMFIDNVEIKTSFSYPTGSAASLPLEFKFEVIEPYSINGFFEALMAAALGAGYADYLQCAFVLIIDFTGYPDGPGLSSPELVGGSLRTFVISIAEIAASLNQSGTTYGITAIPKADLNFGTTVNTLKRKTPATGNTVYELLKNVESNLNKQIEESDQSRGDSSGLHDKYEILFPEFDNDGYIIPGSINKIGKGTYDVQKSSRNNARMSNIDSTPGAYGGKQIGKNTAGQPNTAAAGLLTHSAQFDQGQPLSLVIGSAIRDSSYISDISKGFTSGNAKSVVDPNQMLDYYLVVPEVIETPGTFNQLTNAPYRTYRFMVVPRKLLYNTVVPGQGRQIIDENKLKKLTLRNYNYMYSGTNVDVLDFKIQFNTLYYEALPKGLGNPTKQVSDSDNKPGNGNEPLTTQNKQPAQVGSVSSPVTPPQAVTADAGSNTPNGTPNASSPGSEAWKQMSKLMHDGVINSKGSMIESDLTILGDPYYLTAGGMGNHIVRNNKQGQYAGEQEAAIRAGQVFVSISFSSPVDINKSTGLMEFQKYNLPFSGIYTVAGVISTFKNGMFTQSLKLLRVNGQSLGKQQIPDALNNQFGSRPNPDDVVATDTSPQSTNKITTNNGTVATEATSLNLNGLGIQTNQIDTPGGLGGSTSLVSGATNPAGRFSSSIYGIVPNGTDQLATGIRASTRGLYDAQNSVLGSAASINAVANIFGSSSPISPSALNRISGIATSVDYALTKPLSSPLLNAAVNLPGAINNVQATVDYALNGVTGSIDRAFGVLTNNISNLSSALTSKLSSSLLGTIASIPNNVNLQVAAAQGILIDRLPTLKNIPPIPTPRYGLTNPGFLGGNPVTAETANAAFTNPLDSQYSLLPPVSSSVQFGKLNSTIDLFNKTTNVGSYVESTQLSINSALGNNLNNLSSSVNSAFGSKSNNNSVSPLVMALNNLSSE